MSEKTPSAVTPDVVSVTSEVATDGSEVATPRDEARDFLSQHQIFRTAVQEKTGEVVSGIERVVAETRNVLSTPRNIYLEMRRDAAQNKYDRRAVKRGTSVFKFMNKIHDKRANKAQAKLSTRESKYSAHSSMMDTRITTADSNKAERKATVEAFRNKLAQDKISAEARKLERKERRRRTQEVRGRKLTREQRQKYIDDIDREKLRKAAALAVKQKMNKDK